MELTPIAGKVTSLFRGCRLGFTVTHLLAVEASIKSILSTGRKSEKTDLGSRSDIGSHYQKQVTNLS